MGRYLPAFKDGGPIRTIVNLTDSLGDEYDFRVACYDRDHGDVKPFPSIKHNEWNEVGKANVWYVPNLSFTFKTLKFISRDVDLIYCCGFYENYGYKTLLLNKFKKFGKKPVVVASMGIFSPGALAQKSYKKNLFIKLCKFFGLFKNVFWSVTSELEAIDVKRTIGKDAKCFVAEDLPRSDVLGIGNDSRHGNKIVFLSRICQKKNLLGAIQALSAVKSNVTFDIYGPIEDSAYWSKCLKELEKLPQNILWNYCNIVDSNHVQEIFQKYDMFLFPTFGENFGHVIFESLSAGCIPIISDQTPWREIEHEKAGFVLPLTKEMKEFTCAIEKIVSLPDDSRKIYMSNSVLIAKNKVESSKRKSGYRSIFECDFKSEVGFKDLETLS